MSTLDMNVKNQDNDNDILDIDSEKAITRSVHQQIREKLSSLLVHSDGEVYDGLLQYVLLLIANENTKAQIRHNLSAFFVEETCTIFVDWLWKLLTPLTNKPKQEQSDNPKKEAIETKKKVSRSKERKNEERHSMKMRKRERSRSHRRKDTERRTKHVRKNETKPRRNPDRDNNNNDNQRSARLLSVAMNQLKDDQDRHKRKLETNTLSNWSSDVVVDWAKKNRFSSQLVDRLRQKRVDGTKLDELASLIETLRNKSQELGLDKSNEQRAFFSKLCDELSGATKNSRRMSDVYLPEKKTTKPISESESETNHDRQPTFSVTFDRTKDPSVESNLLKERINQEEQVQQKHIERNRETPKMRVDLRPMDEQRSRIDSRLQRVVFTRNNDTYSRPNDDTNRVKQRCQFWPNCSSGSSCPYFHPTEICSFYPNCSYGENCIYIHVTNGNIKDKHSDEKLTEECYYGTNCARVNCMFSHPKSDTICKFGGKCKRLNCNYSHEIKEEAGGIDSKNRLEVKQIERVCRFDKRCEKIQCPFQHPIRDAESVALILGVDETEEEEKQNESLQNCGTVTEQNDNSVLSVA